MNQDPGVSAWAAQFIDGQPINITPGKGKYKRNPTVRDYLDAHPGEFTYTDTIDAEEIPREPAPMTPAAHVARAAIVGVMGSAVFGACVLGWWLAGR